MVFPGLGYVLAILIVIGGLALNIGNIAGAGLGLNAITDISPTAGVQLVQLLRANLLVKEAEKQWIASRKLQVLSRLG